MRLTKRVSKKIYRFIRAEIKGWITLENNRCQSSSLHGKRCIKQGDHLLWHEDAWRDWWWQRINTCMQRHLDLNSYNVQRGLRMKITRRQLRQVIVEACGCGSAPEPKRAMHHSPGRTRINIDDMAPADAFALGLAMGQSGEFDNIVEPPTVEDAFYPEEVEAREDVWSGGDNLDDPLDHAHFETGEHNAGPHVRTGGCAMREVTRNQLRDLIKEEILSLNM